MTGLSTGSSRHRQHPQQCIFQRGDLIGLTVTPNDGIDDGPSVSSSLTIANSPPTAPTVELTPEDPVEGLDDLLCSVLIDSTDEDNDPVTYTYSWTLDGQSTSHTTDTISATLTLAGDTWACTVTPNDGIDDGQPTSETVTIRSDCSSLELDGADDGLIIAEQDNCLG